MLITSIDLTHHMPLEHPMLSMLVLLHLTLLPTINISPLRGDHNLNRLTCHLGYWVASPT